ncbi:MAG: RNA polymerase sigma-70 factor [Spirosomataceae bacterium]
MANPTFTDEQLVKRLLVDGDAALRELYNRYAKRLYSLALYKTGSRETAEEIVQEIFVKLWENRERLQIEHVESYLFTALKYQIISHLRSSVAQRRVQTVEDDLPQITAPSDYTIGVEEIRLALEQSVSQLPAKTRQIFVMSRMDELSHREIAAQLDLSEKTVEYHIAQALKYLRLSLKEYLLALLIPLLGF